VRASVADEVLLVEVSDDGVGGADPAAGTGLRGLADGCRSWAAASTSPARPKLERASPRRFR
jgi:hypothetical protein